MEQQSKVALVTGASRGIGRAIAAALADAGHLVIGTATSEPGADAIAERLQQSGNGGTGMTLDLRDPASCQNVIAQITERYSAPQILVNNGGITRDNLLMRMKDEDWDAVLDTNLGGAARLARLCLRGMMKARWGRIISITSVVASAGNPGQANYCAAKAALEGFSRSLACEVGSRAITVNCVAPGFIDTDMTRELPETQREQLLAGVPLGRLGQPEDIAAMVAFLASEQAGYITGQTLHVNGGMYLA